MPQIEWPKRRIPCATLALVTNSPNFYVRKADRIYLPEAAECVYIVGSAGNETRTNVTAHLHPTLADTYQLHNADTGALISPVAAQFKLEQDAGVLVNYPSRPILNSPSMVSNTSIHNPRRVTAYDAGQSTYTGSVEIDVIRRENAGIVDAFIDQLHDPRNWFELPLPGSHLGGTYNVSGYDSSTHTITIVIPYSAASTSIHDENLHGWWVRVGNRTGRITWHDVGITTSNTPSGFAYTHQIRIAPQSLITGTYASNNANNFARHKTMRVRANSVSATGNPDFAGSWIVEFTETDGAV